MGRIESTARSRELGAKLRDVRDRASVSGAKLAAGLGWQASKVSRVENGTYRVTEIDVAMIGAFCHAHPEDVDELRELCRQVDDGHWLQPHGEKAPDELVTLVLHETTAGLIHCYEPLLIPGLLQTEAYARGLFADAGVSPPAFVESRIGIRMDRQVIFRREIPPQTEFFVHEQVLHSAPASNPAVMSEQLVHLMLATSRAECTIRVIPRVRCGQGAFGGAFRLMEFSDHGPVGYIENHTASVFLEGKTDIHYYRNLLTKLAVVALDGEESRKLLATLASWYEREGPP